MSVPVEPVLRDVHFDLCGNKVADAHGLRNSVSDVRGRNIDLPAGTRIVDATPVVFQPNGSVTANVDTVIEGELSDEIIDRWTVSTNRIGVTTVVRERVE